MNDRALFSTVHPRLQSGVALRHRPAMAAQPARLYDRFPLAIGGARGHVWSWSATSAHDPELYFVAVVFCDAQGDLSSRTTWNDWKSGWGRSASRSLMSISPAR